ncbi:MAG TPA: cytochrome B6, partial [Chloroflexota bacterium]
MMARKKAYYRGVRMAPYDLVKEFLVAMAVVTVLVLLVSLVLSSPDEPPVTIQSVAQGSPQTYMQTSLDSLDGNSPIAGYGPPYNDGTGSVQYIGPISLQKLIGVHIPVDTAQAFVLGPLEQAAATNPTLKAELARFNAASSKQQAAWEDAYNNALARAKESPPNVSVPACACGPVAPMMMALLREGQSGAMDGLLLTSGHFYQTDYTRPLLFMQNDAVAAKAASFNLLGST